MCLLTMASSAQLAVVGAVPACWVADRRSTAHDVNHAQNIIQRRRSSTIQASEAKIPERRNPVARMPRSSAFHAWHGNACMISPATGLTPSSYLGRAGTETASEKRRRLAEVLALCFLGLKKALSKFVGGRGSGSRRPDLDSRLQRPLQQRILHGMSCKRVDGLPKLAP